MFEVGFGEIVLLVIVGLLVLGPERLPTAIRTVSLWLGRFKRSYKAIRDDIERELGADEIRRQLHNEEVMHNLKNTKQELNRISSSIPSSATFTSTSTPTQTSSPAVPSASPSTNHSHDEQR